MPTNRHASSAEQRQIRLAKRNEALLARVQKEYATQGYSPEDKLCRIFAACHEYFARLSYVFVQQALNDNSPLSGLDDTITAKDIDSSSNKWVANTRHLTDNAVSNGLLAVIESVRGKVHEDVWQEIWSIIGPLIEERAWKEYNEEQAQANQMTQQRFTAAGGGIISGPVKGPQNSHPKP